MAERTSLLPLLTHAQGMAMLWLLELACHCRTRSLCNSTPQVSRLLLIELCLPCSGTAAAAAIFSLHVLQHDPPWQVKAWCCPLLCSVSLSYCLCAAQDCWIACCNIHGACQLQHVLPRCCASLTAPGIRAHIHVENPRISLVWGLPLTS